MANGFSTDPIRVFLVDDHRTMLWGLERLVESAAPQLQLVGTASNRDELMARVPEAKPDIIVLDLDLGGEDGGEMLPDLLRETQAQILVLTGNRDTEVHQRVMLHGARGVVLKDEGAEVVLAAIRKVHAGEVWLDRGTLGKILGAIAGGGARASRDPDAVKIEGLTQREREIIAATVQHKGAGNKIIADRMHISEHTLRNHLSVIYRKLGIHGRLELFIYAAKHGLAV